MQIYRNLPTAIVAFTITLMTVSCGNSEKSNEKIDFERCTISKTTMLSDENNSPKCKVDIAVDFAQTGNSNIDKAVNADIEKELFNMENLTIKAAADSFTNQYARDYKKNLTPLYREDRTDKTKKAWYEYTYRIKTEADEGRSGITVYKADIEYYEGGAHGVSIQMIMNFNNETGRRMNLKDVFVPGSDKRLSDILLRALEDKTGKKTIDELQADGYLCTTNIYAPRNFILGKDAITFVYNTYEIAPYEKGRTELTVSYDDVKDLLVKDLQ